MASQAEARVARREGGALLTRVAAHRASPRYAWLIYAVLIVGAVVSIGPFIYMVLTSLKDYGSLIDNIMWPWPPLGTEPFQWHNYVQAIQDAGWDKDWGTWLFLRYFANSAIVATITVAGVLATSSLSAYAFAQMSIPGKNVLFVIVLATIMVPSDLVLVPKVVLMFDFGWYNTYAALVVPFLVSVFGIFLLRQFFQQVPRDLFDAAQLDGAGHVQYLWSIMLPLSYPAVITLALFTLVWSWDEFKWPLLVTRDSNMRVLGVGLQQFMVGEGGTKAQLMMALATLMILPVLAFYFVTQKHFAEAMITSGIKG
ncbi:MAG: carbohydrate ABC transporter permease [Chloroflexota bacterium]